MKLGQLGSLASDKTTIELSLEQLADIEAASHGALRGVGRDPAAAFRILVGTPEKIDLLLRGGWEAKIGRPLTLVVVDEAHNLSSGDRGLKLELLLATINRECRNSQFLLMTPFIENGDEVARWLSPDSHADMSVHFDCRG